ncbi:MAG: PepSY domain-containing protein [Acidobacteriaceae bacterium]|nr:PepSY domain-containing protein [Acidobacteriaceae bacterium]
MPEGTVAGLQLPAKLRASYVVQMRTEETSPAVHSFVVVDQYSGKVLAMQKFKSSLGHRVIRFNRSLHTGDILGSLGHTIMSLTSLVLVVMVLTGIVIWWKKLAI